MRLGIDIWADKGEIIGLVFESPREFRLFSSEIQNAIRGENENICISEGNKIIRCSKDIQVVFSPEYIDVNDRKILGHLYDSMEEMAKQEFFEDISEINTAIISLIDRIADKVFFPLRHELNLMPASLFKEYSVSFDYQDNDLAEKIVNYVKTVHQILGVEIFIFFHITDYLSKEEILLLSETIKYEQINLIIVGNQFHESLPGKWVIVDEDRCLIEM